LDGFRVTASSIDGFLSDRAPGDTVRLTIFRREKLAEITVKLAARPAEVYRIEKIEAAKETKSNAD
jgi:predicted metalloprotease with PDZ domain